MFDLLIIYADGSRHIVRDVNTYDYKIESGHYYYKKNNWYSYIPQAQVRFIGRLFDYNDEEDKTIND